MCSVQCVTYVSGHSAMMNWPDKGLLRVYELPEEVDPAKSTATLDGQTLEVRMPKVGAVNTQSRKAKRASSGK